MSRITLVFLAFLIPVTDMKEFGYGQEKQPTPAEQFNALKRESSLASSSGVPMSDVERLRFVGQAYKHRYALAHKFVELAEKYPSDPVALDALIQAVWQVNTTPWPVELVGQDTARGRAFNLIQCNHIRSDKLAPLCRRISFGFCKEYESFLKMVMKNNPHREVLATATLSFGHYLHNRQQRLDMCREQPELARDFEGLYGKDYLAGLLAQDRRVVRDEIEELLERAIRHYGSVRTEDGGTIEDVARAELFEIRHLSIGCEAPNITGKDQDGKLFSLSDYRGKVVLLDFWSYV